MQGKSSAAHVTCLVALSTLLLVGLKLQTEVPGTGSCHHGKQLACDNSTTLGRNKQHHSSQTATSTITALPQ